MNPFSLTPYNGPEDFCDRIDETAYIINAIKNRRHLTLHAIRRLGKTGLIMHVQQALPKNYVSVLIDAYDTRSDVDLVQKIISTVIAAIDQKKNFLQKALSLFAQYKASITLDPMLGTPTLSLELKNQSEAKTSLQVLWSLIKNDSKTIYQIAIDEFQTISTYQDSTIDATIREALQTLPNVRFIFSGSQRHLLLDLFGNAKRPLFHTTELMELQPIPYPAYMEFIKNQFKKHDKIISDEHIHSILKWTKEHTYYVQYFCHHLFDKVTDKVEPHHIERIKQLIYNQNQPNYYQFRSILTSSQWKVLTAIANENILRQPNSNEIRTKYNLGAASTTASALESLVEKDMVYTKYDQDGKISYQVYDVFLSRWIAWKKL